MRASETRRPTGLSLAFLGLWHRWRIVEGLLNLDDAELLIVCGGSNCESTHPGMIIVLSQVQRVSHPSSLLTEYNSGQSS